MNITARHIERIVDPERLWQVRRFCQARHSPGKQTENTYPETSGGDAALSALLKCLIHELDCDLAAISLLDDQTQFFLCVEHAIDLHDPTLGGVNWFGCDKIPIRGGICERTISRAFLDDDDRVYEILDLTNDDCTKSLPVVDGTLASFRHYAGVPITVTDDLHIGALFVFHKKPFDSPMSVDKCRFLNKTARYTAEHLTRVIGALDNSRSLACNSAASAFLQTDFSDFKQSVQDAKRQSQNANDRLMSSSQMYETAADIILQTFDFEGVIIQELSSRSATTSFRLIQKSAILGEKFVIPRRCQGPISESHVAQLCEAFPHGAVLHLASSLADTIFISQTRESTTPRAQIRLEFAKDLSDPKQLVFMPLRDDFHDRDTAFILGWTSQAQRIYSSSTDLASLAAFGTNMTVQLRRLESVLMARKKSDFLGSISHEMRSPLHGLLACARQLQELPCSAEQIQLLNSVEICGVQLQSNIDKILEYAKIGSSKRELAQKLTRKNLTLLLEELTDNVARKHQALDLSVSVENLTLDGPNVALFSRPTDSCVRPVVIFETGSGSDLEVHIDHRVETIVENILDNSFKFSDRESCIRICLEADEDSIKMTFADTGRGIPRDFVRHDLLNPFVQKDPLDNGVGLGLVLVHDAVRELDGVMALETDETTGTKITVTLPWHSLDIAPDEKPALSQVDAHVAPQDRAVSTPHGVALFPPSRWTKVDAGKQKQYFDVFLTSLSAMLAEISDSTLEMWDPNQPLPRVLLVFDDDLVMLKQKIGHGYEQVQKIVYRDSQRPNRQSPLFDLEHCTALTGPFTATKLRVAINACLDQHRRDDKNGIASEGASNELNLSATEATLCEPASADLPKNHLKDMECDSSSASTGPHPADPSPDTVDSVINSSDPRFLLVDDNAINLKVIAMFAKKCSTKPFVMASSGKQAVDCFTSAWHDEEQAVQPAFDIIMLDLSMPEISGFDVAAAVRALEQTHPQRSRTYIAALTGLTSDKDRSAAFAAGVDEYVTKPATIKDLQNVISHWRIARSSGSST